MNAPPRAPLFDAPAVAQRLDALGVSAATCRQLRQQFMDHLRAEYDRKPAGAEIVQARTAFVDLLLRRIWADQVEGTAAGDRLALVAVGGYGRGELHACSDVDILVLAARGRDITRAADTISRFVTFLYDVGLDIGASVRSVRQCLDEGRRDVTIATNLIEARLLMGDEALFEQLCRRTGPRQMWPTRKFFAAKLAEQRARYDKYDATAYKLEPNVKESPGGLRDIHTIGWVAKRHFGARTLHELVDHQFLEQDEYELLREGQEFLSEVRNGLHLLTGRKHDHLLFDQQRELARRFGYQDSDQSLAVEQFMKRYYRTVKGLSRLNEMLLQHFEEEILLARRSDRATPLNSRFQIRKGFIEARDERVFRRYPFALLEIFLLLQQHRRSIRGVRADTVRLIRRHLHLIDDRFRADLRCTSLFMEIIRQPHGIGHELQRMHRYGVLARYIPAFGRVVGQMQHDLFHVYTVDEHSLFVLRNTRSYAFPDEKISALELGYQVYPGIPKPALLYLAALFHDIAKGRGGDHSDLGTHDAAEFCRLHRLSDLDGRLVAWLVRRHLLMSKVSQRQDIGDPEVIRAFAATVGDQVHLDYLYLLTVADMRGTGPTVWNSWKGSLLGTLYLATRRALRRGLGSPIDAHDQALEVRARAAALLPAEQVDSRECDQFWNRLDDDYFLRFEAEEIAWHAKHILRARGDHPTVVATRDFPNRGSTGVMVYTRDRKYLFAAITSTLDRLGLDIVDARIYTSHDGDALDAFLVTDLHGERVSDPAQRREIRAALRDTLLQDTLSLSSGGRRSTRQQKAFRVDTEVSFTTDLSRDRTVLELITKDRPGLLSKVAQALAECGLVLQNARVNTYGERAEDAFFVTDANGHAVTDAGRLDALERQLVQRLDGELKPAA
ncbi:[protein-PII] uridylyltransferase [Immundisolibacter sp.]|uniref:[protein-PII] uridylyltransferase n=1 Tax=Immundisolibacter sp. TaxID=1934948 RepID=UPI00356823D9